MNELYHTTVHRNEQIDIMAVGSLSQRQRQVDGVERRLQYGQDAPKVVIVLGRVGQADDDLVEPHAVRRGQAGGRAVQDSHPALVAASTQNQALSALLFLYRRGSKPEGLMPVALS